MTYEEFIENWKLNHPEYAYCGPHCDPRVLHAPNSCVYCDEVPEWQQFRIDNKINFTGENDKRKTLCPADIARGFKGAHKWGGNTPKPKGCKCTMFGLSQCPVHDNGWNTKCPKCGDYAYQGLNNIVCINGC